MFHSARGVLRLPQPKNSATGVSDVLASPIPDNYQAALCLSKERVFQKSNGVIEKVCPGFW